MLTCGVKVDATNTHPYCAPSRLVGSSGRLKDATRLSEVEAPGATCLALHPFRPLLVPSPCMPRSATPPMHIFIK